MLIIKVTTYVYIVILFIGFKVLRTVYETTIKSKFSAVVTNKRHDAPTGTKVTVATDSKISAVLRNLVANKNSAKIANRIVLP